jgi:hypothetical protein
MVRSGGRELSRASLHPLCGLSDADRRQLTHFGATSSPKQAVSPSRSRILAGGYFGSWLDSGSERRNSRCSEEVAARVGGGRPARAIVGHPTSARALGEAARVSGYLTDQSAGQCGPCVHCLGALAGAASRRAIGSLPERVKLG